MNEDEYGFHPDDLIDHDYYEGDPSREYDATSWGWDNLNESYLGNERYSHDLISASAPRGLETLTLGELVESGYQDWEEGYEPYTMDPEVLEVVRYRLNARIKRLYYFREISCLPIKKWAMLLDDGIEDILNELGPLYNVVVNGINVLDQGVGESKTVAVNSQYPQARVRTNDTTQHDYASDSAESQNQTVAAIAQVDAIARYNEKYRELDRQVLDRVDEFFTHTVIFQ